MGLDVTGKRRRLSVVLLLFLCSCAVAPNQWTYERIPGSKAEYTSAHTTFEPDTAQRKLSLEILQAEYGRRFYLHLHSLPAVEARDRPGYVPVQVKSSSQSFTMLTQPMHGHQTLLVSDADMDQFISTLQTDGSVLLSLRGYREVRISAENLTDSLESLETKQSSFLSLNPFQ